MAEQTPYQAWLAQSSVKPPMKTVDTGLAAHAAPAGDYSDLTPFEAWSQQKAKEGGVYDKNSPSEKQRHPVDEMHPAFTFADRAYVKNTANSPENAVRFLRLRHPELQLGTNSAGQIVAKKPDESDYRVLDPKSTRSFKEAGLDVVDLGADVAQGVLGATAQATGGAIGAALAAPTLNPLLMAAGARMGASVAGAGMDAGTEYLKQKIGQYLGVNDKVNMQDVGTAAAWGGAMPVIAGTGAGRGIVKSVASRLAPGASESTIAHAVAAQRGIPGTIFDNAVERWGPKATSLITNTPEAVLKNYKANPTIVKDFDEKTRRAIFEPKAQQVNDILTTAQANASATYHDLVRNQSGAIDLAKAKAPLEKYKQEAIERYSRVPTQKNMSSIEQTQAVLDEFFPSTSPKVTSQMEADAIVKRASAGDAKPVEAISVGDAHVLNQSLAEIGDYTGYDKNIPGKTGLKGDFSDKGLQLRVRDAMADINNQMDTQTGGATKKIRSDYAQMKNKQEAFAKKLSSAEELEKNMSSAYQPKNRMFLEDMMEFDKENGTDLAQLALNTSTQKKMSTLPWINAETGKSVLTHGGLAAAGGTAGYLLGAQSGNSGDRMLGGYAGAILGGLAGMPKMIPKYRNLGLGISKTMSPAWGDQSIRRAIITSPYEAMQPQKEGDM